MVKGRVNMKLSKSFVEAFDKTAPKLGSWDVELPANGATLPPGVVYANITEPAIEFVENYNWGVTGYVAQDWAGVAVG
jgi:hypothetical protein